MASAAVMAVTGWRIPFPSIQRGAGTTLGKRRPERKPDERGHPLVGASFEIRREPIAARRPTIVLTVWRIRA